MEFDPLSKQVIGLAIEAHRHLGPGLLETTYMSCPAYELSMAGIPFAKEHPLPVRYKEVVLDCGFRIDLLLPGKMVIKGKSVNGLLPIHDAQILTYMKLACTPLGLLINFNARRLKDNIRRFVL